MGGDHAPRELVRGAARAALELDVRISLVGRRAEIEAELDGLDAELARARPALGLVEASEVIAMDEHPATAVRAKRNASVVVACGELAEGRARAAVSAGNSGAVLAAALFSVRRVHGVARPAIGALIPTARGTAFLLDVGANTDCRPEWLAQFAVMGSVYAERMMGVAAPRVALLSNGEERGKGNELVQRATPLCEAAAIDFRGNVEGKDVFRGDVDVVVCDGFDGNIAIKTAEGVAEFLLASIREAASGSLSGRIGGLLLRPRLRPLRDRVDYRKTGGALLLGVAGEVVIAHGRSDAEAVRNAIAVAARAAEAGVSASVATALADTADPSIVEAAAPAEPAATPEKAATS